MRSQNTTPVMRAGADKAFPRQGQLSEVNVIQLLRSLYFNRSTGVLSFVCPNAVTHSVSFLQGDIVAASSDMEDLRLGLFFYRLNQISLEQLKTALSSVNGEQQIGEILVDKGYISQEARQEGLTAQFREILNTVFLLTDARYTFVPQEAIFAENLQLFLDTEELLEEGEQLVTHVSRFSRELEREDQVYALGSEWPPSLRREHEELLRYIDGQRTSSEILTMSPFDKTATTHLLWQLLKGGLLEKVAVHPIRRTERPSVYSSQDDLLAPSSGSGRPPQREAEPSPTPSSEPLPTPTPEQLDPELGVFLSAQSVLDRIDMNEASTNYTLTTDGDSYRVVEMPSTDSVVEACSAEEDEEAVAAEADSDFSMDTTVPEDTSSLPDDAVDIPLDAAQQTDALFEDSEVSEEIRQFLEDAAAYVADQPAPRPTPHLTPGATASSDSDEAQVPTTQAPPFVEAPVDPELSLEEELDDDYESLPPQHIQVMEGTAQPTPEPASSELLELDQPLFGGDSISEEIPPVRPELAEEDNLEDEAETEAIGREIPLLGSPKPLRGTALRRRDPTEITRQEMAVLSSIRGIFRPRARDGEGAKTRLRPPAPEGEMQASQKLVLTERGELFNQIYSTIFATFSESLGEERATQIFGSFFSAGHSTFPEVFHGVRFEDDGRLDSDALIRNLGMLSVPSPVEVFDVSLNEVFYFLLQDVSSFLEPDEQETMMEAIMPLRSMLFRGSLYA